MRLPLYVNKDGAFFKKIHLLFVRVQHQFPVNSPFFEVGDSNNVGKPPFDRLMMFKLLILQSLYNLSDMTKWSTRSPIA